MLKIMIIGATSAIAHETARYFADEGASFFLVALEEDRLQSLSDDLTVRGAKQVSCMPLDVLDFERHTEVLNKAVEAMDGLDAVLLAYGTLTDQTKAQEDFAYMEREFRINALSVMSLLTPIANYFEEQRRGSIAVISSVAGDRGRMSNYAYGTAKAAVSTYLQGLRARLDKAGVSVLTIKPGLVDTPMTANLKKNPMYSSPVKVGGDIHKAMKNGSNIAYTPWFWMFIMMIIRNVPERFFKKLSM